MGGRRLERDQPHEAGPDHRDPLLRAQPAAGEGLQDAGHGLAQETVDGDAGGERQERRCGDVHEIGVRAVGEARHEIPRRPPVHARADRRDLTGQLVGDVEGRPSFHAAESGLPP